MVPENPLCCASSLEKKSPITVMWFFSPGYSVGMLDQEPELDPTKTVKEVVEEGVQETVDILKAYEVVNNRFMEELSDEEMSALIDEQGKLTDLIEQKKMPGSLIANWNVLWMRCAVHLLMHQ